MSESITPESFKGKVTFQKINFIKQEKEQRLQIEELEFLGVFDPNFYKMVNSQPCKIYYEKS